MMLFTLALLAVANLPAESPPRALPGEKEFSSCLRLRPEQRFHLNLKPETDVEGLIGWISSATCRQFIVGSGVPLQGRKVTVISPQDLEVREAYPLFIALLDSVQLTVEPVGKFLRIVESAKAGRSGAPFYPDGAARAGEGYATQLVRLKNAEPTELARVLDAFKGDSGAVTPYPSLSAVILTDREANLQRMTGIIAELDAPGEAQKLWVLPVHHLSVKELAERLTEILGKLVAVPKGASAPGSPPITGTVRLFADDRSGRLLVVGSEAGFARVSAVVGRLDVPVASGVGRVHVYRCKHADCDAVAALLGTLSGVDVSRGPAPSSTRSTRSPASSTPAPLPSAARPMGEAAPIFDGSVRVTSDPTTNSILTLASLDDFRTLQRLAEEIDVPRKQVWIEATIMEVLLTKDRVVGVGYSIGDQVQLGGKPGFVGGGWQPATTLLLDPKNIGSTLVGLSGIALGAPLDGVADALGLPKGSIPSLGAFFHLLQSDQNVNLVANPHILITNNYEGEISVGQKIPFQNGITAVPGGTTGIPFLPISREDVALTLTLTPHVNEDNLIRLEINQEMSEVAGTDSTFGPTTSQRKTRTTVFVHDHQPIIVGGLMRDKIVDGAQKIPLLGDIPVLGALFRNSHKSVEKQNILIAVTPHVIEGPRDLAQVLESKLRERREFIKYFGTDLERRTLGIDGVGARTPGMLEQINRAVAAAEKEEAQAQAEELPTDPVPM